MKQRKKNGNAVHYKEVPCGSRSIYGVESTKEKKEVTCAKCRELLLDGRAG